jgi:cold shock CspA family protein
MSDGVVKWFGGRYGFISVGEGADIFVHSSYIIGSDHLVEGDRVSFDITLDARTGRTKATNVTVI